jgi:hypothetical protein
MNYTKEINKLWEQIENSINSASADGVSELRDYASNDGWHHDLAKLVDAETANERQHRGGRPEYYRAPISAPVAAKILLMNNIAEGSEKTEMPPATIFLQFRKTAAEGWVIGFLARKYITAEWRARVGGLDYAAIMNRRAA